MSHLETNLTKIKQDLVQMWSLVGSQMERARLALINNDKDLAREVRANEKMVDAYELMIDMDCENIIMLQNPVAVDLRFLFSVLKINYNLERIGDYANAIAKSVEHSNKDWKEGYINAIHLHEMFFVAQTMIQQSMEAFEMADRKKVKGLFTLDQKLDSFNDEATPKLMELMKSNLDDLDVLLDSFAIVRRLERAGDHIKNIAEELIFYFDAIVIKHSKLKK